MTLQPKPYLTPAQYLALERAAPYKSEYLDGEVFAMAGASPNHNYIAGNIYMALRLQSRGRGCNVYMSEMRVQITATGLYTYPDIVMVCGQPQFADGWRDMLLNPTVIFEVLSPSTENYDRGRKFDHYKTLQPFTDYVLVAQDRPWVAHHSRADDGPWLTHVVEDNGAVLLNSVNCTLSLRDIYAEVAFNDM